MTDVPVRGSGLIGRAVRWTGIRLGVAVDLLLDRELRRAVGVVVRSGDGHDRFLPLPACVELGDSIVPSSPLVLVNGDGLAFYQREGLSLEALRGSLVLDSDETRQATVEDVLLCENGDVAAISLSSDAARIDLPREALDVDGLGRLRWTSGR